MFGSSATYSVFVLYQWTKALAFPTERYVSSNRYSEGIVNRPSVVAVCKREGEHRN